MSSFDATAKCRLSLHRCNDISLYNEISSCIRRGSTPNPVSVRPEGLQGVVLAIAQERRIDLVLDRIARTVGAQDGVALARVWLVEPGDVCGTCGMRAECPDQARCLHLVASAGTPLAVGGDW